MITVQTSDSVVAHNQPVVQGSEVLFISKLFFLSLACSESHLVPFRNADKML